MPILKAVAPTGGATGYDRSHLMTYADLLDADAQGITWQRGATTILGVDTQADADAARLCWDSHLARARWIVGEGLRRNYAILDDLGDAPNFGAKIDELIVQLSEWQILASGQRLRSSAPHA